MIKEDNNEKDYKFIKIFIIGITFSFILFFALFFIGILRVEAADYQTLNPSLIETQFIDPNGTTDQIESCAYDNIGACNLNLTTAENQRFSMKFSASYYGSASNSISVNYVVGYKGLGNQGLDAVFPTNSVVVRYLNAQNGVVKDVSSNCSTNARKVSGRGDTPTGVPSYHTYFIVTTTCNIINPEGNANKLQIYVTSQTNNTLQSSTYARIGSYTLNRISGTINDTDRILANNIQNTQWIINNIESGTSSIVNGIDAAKDGIIQNQDENTDKIIESMKGCTNYDFKNTQNISDDVGHLINNGTINSNNTTWVVSKYTKVNKSKTYKIISGGNSPAYCLYDKNKNMLSCASYSNSNTINVTPTQDGYIRYSIPKSDTNFRFTGEYCANGNEIVNDSVNDLNDTLTDSSVDNPSSALNGMENYFGTNGVISDLLLLPVRMWQSILNAVGGTCQPFNLGSLYNHQLTMPCINLSSRLGSAIYGVIDVLISGFFILGIRKKFVDIFENFTSLKTGGNELE